MPTMQEVRAKYPQYSDMSDDALAGALYKKYYSDMPREEFDAKLGLKPAAPEPKGTHRWSVLPLESNLDTGETSLALPRMITAIPDVARGLLDSGESAVSSVRRAWDGELQMTGPDGRTSPEAIAEAANVATWMTPMSSAAGTGVGIARAAGVDAATAARKAAMPGRQAAVAAQNIGVSLPKAVASDSASVQQMGKIISNVPIAGQPLRKASQAAITQLDDAAMNVQKGLGAGDVAVAGHAIRSDLSKYALSTEPEAVSALYKNVDSMVKPDVLSPLSKTAEIAKSITVSNEAATLPAGNAVAMVKEAISRPGMDYASIKKLRTRVNELRNDSQLLKSQNINQQELDKIYDGLTADLRASIGKAGGPEAVKAWEQANQKAAVFARDKKALAKVLGDSDGENLASRVIAMAKTTSRADVKTLALAKSKVSPESWNEVASAALAEMGRDAKGAFTPDRWETAWGKLSPSGKKLLISDPTTLKALEDISTVSSRFKKLNEYANPSGTGQAVIGGGYLPGLWVAPTTTVASLVGTNVMARLMSRPASVRALAEYSKAYEVAAKMPGDTSQKLLADKAKKLALIAANDAGQPEMAGSIASKIGTPQRAGANDGNDNGIGNPEGAPSANDPGKAFNDAYLQGRAL